MSESGSKTERDTQSQPEAETEAEAEAQSETEDRVDDREEWVEFVCVHLDGETYALELGRIARLVRNPSVTRVPRTGATIAGVTTLGGDIVVVIDGRALFDLPDRPTDADTVLLLLDQGPAHQVGLLVDHVPGIDPYHVDQITAPEAIDDWQPPIDDRWFRAVIEEADRTPQPLGVIDAAAIIADARERA